jgi:hypothetical protein
MKAKVRQARSWERDSTSGKMVTQWKKEVKRMWTKKAERKFFSWTFKKREAKPEQLFYCVEDKHFFYLPTGIRGQGQVMQARNSWVGEFTEKWAEKFLKPIVKELGLHLVRKAVIAEWGLVKQRAADLAICRKPELQQPEIDVIALIEVKMSIVWNWEWKPQEGKIVCAGDFQTHQGRPSVLRSDTVLKALGKAIEVRSKGFNGAFFVLCNTPIPDDYQTQIDGCKRMGVMQGFFSVNPKPLDNKDTLKQTDFKGYLRWDSSEEAFETLSSLLTKQFHFFSAHLSLDQLGQLIERASQESSPQDKARRFLEALKEVLEDVGES